METLPIAHEDEQICESAADIVDAARFSGLSQIVRLVRIDRTPCLPKVSLREHLQQADDELKDLATFGLDVPAYEWCLIPNDLLGHKARYRFSDPDFSVDGFRVGARVELINQATHIADRAVSLRETAYAISCYKATRTHIALGDMYSHQVVQGTTQNNPTRRLFYVDIEPYLRSV